MNILVVDDDKLVARSLKTILEAGGNVKVLATGHSGSDAVELYKEHHPEVLLMDIRMDGMTGLEAAENIIAFDANARILFLTTFSDDEYIVKALNLGAKGYILKQDFDGIEAALVAVCGGQNVFGNEVVSKIPELMKTRDEYNFEEVGISRKEREIIEQVAQGLSNKEIAQRLFLSEGTIRNYISEILEKLQLRDRTQLAVFYYQKVK